MIDTDDIRAAVGAGVLTEAQAASLTALAESRRGAREGLSPGDEPFELFRGFNEVFVMVGLVILAAGWVGVVGWTVYDQLETWRSTSIFYSGVSAALLWLLAEYFVRRRRMVGPAILLTVMFAGNAAFGFIQKYAQVFMLAQEDFSSLILPGLLTVGAVFVFWLRFKVPFAMALMAMGLFGTALLSAAVRSGSPQGITDIFVFSAESSFAWITLALGIAVFCVAMFFDGSDPHRVTRRSAQGFWLHLVAAPMIINTVALSLLSNENESAYSAILAAMAAFAAIAIVIDRRSFLLAAIAYVVSVLLTLNPALEDASGAGVILGLGVSLVLLGAFWARIRAALLNALPLGGLRNYLPPAH
ncbi:MAG: hypothetical protein AAFR73_06935 [Pseudomonadota bacterium]